MANFYISTSSHSNPDAERDALLMLQAIKKVKKATDRINTIFN